MKLFKPKFWESNNLITYLIWPLTLVTKIIILLKHTNNIYKSKVKSICVGNIYLGGTGKTQLVIKISEILKKKHKIFVIKKNYKNQIDEQKLIKKKSNLILTKARVDGIKKINKNKKISQFLMMDFKINLCNMILRSHALVVFQVLVMANFYLLVL